MKYYFLIPLLMFLAKNVRADEAPPVMQNRDWEIRLLGANVGYSKYSGMLFGARADAAVKLSPRLQWSLGFAANAATRGRDTFSVFTGPRYNFSDDLSRAWFVGAGAEYGDRWRCCGTKKTINGLFEVGKRFRLNDSGSWTYAPSAEWSFDSGYAYVSVRPLTFTYSF